MINTYLIFIVFFTLTSCNKSSPVSQMPPSGIAGSNQKPQQTDTQTIMEQAIISGTVIETTPAEGICFVRIQHQKNKDVWAALLRECPHINTKITIKSELQKTNFLSQQINRKFDKLYFGEITT